MSVLPVYKSRKNNIIIQSTVEPIDFLALDWYECDLISDLQIEKKKNYLNQ